MSTDTISSTFNDRKLHKVTMLFRAINHEIRLEMLEVISNKGEVNVTSLRKLLGLEQAVTSLHLGFLKRANLVLSRREGRVVYYSVNILKIEKVNKFIDLLV